MTPAQLQRFNKRTYQLFSNHRRYLREALDNKKQELPFALGFLRVEASKAIDRRMACPYCKAPLTISTLSLDHKVPRCRAVELKSQLLTLNGVPNGGAPDSFYISLAFGWPNYDFVCKVCNKRKGDLTHYEFAQLLSLVTTMGQKASRYILTKLGARLPFYKKAKGVTA